MWIKVPAEGMNKRFILCVFMPVPSLWERVYLFPSEITEVKQFAKSENLRP